MGKQPVGLCEATPLVVEVVPTVVVIEEVSTGPPSEMLTASCAKEMASAQGNQSRVKAAKKCEDETVFKNETVEFLQKAEKEKAVAEVEKSLTQCLGISAKCAKEISPRV